MSGAQNTGEIDDGLSRFLIKYPNRFQYNKGDRCFLMTNWND